MKLLWPTLPLVLLYAATALYLKDRYSESVAYAFSLMFMVLLYMVLRVRERRLYGLWRSDMEQIWLPYYAMCLFLLGALAGVNPTVLYAICAMLLLWWLGWIATIFTKTNT